MVSQGFIDPIGSQYYSLIACSESILSDSYTCHLFNSELNLVISKCLYIHSCLDN